MANKKLKVVDISTENEENITPEILDVIIEEVPEVELKPEIIEIEMIEGNIISYEIIKPPIDMLKDEYRLYLRTGILPDRLK